MVDEAQAISDWMSLPPREAWIEMLEPRPQTLLSVSRFPHGKRGLKLDGVKEDQIEKMSLPPREAWIEILLLLNLSIELKRVASPTGSVD